jgi:phosphotriesterase-related protein
MKPKIYFMKKVSYLTLYPAMLVLLVLATGCRSEKDYVMTVDGPLPAHEMGTTLPHEHFLVDFIGADSTGYHRWNRDTVIAKVLPYLQEAVKAGINTIVDCTPAFLGRDPLLLQRLANLSGLKIITNTGYYGAIDNKALPPSAFSHSADQLAEIWINEWTKGIDSTHIRPGFIKIAIPGDSILSPVHEKLVRAAARTHLRTGLTINAHTGPDAPVLAELRVLKEEGVDPSAFIWTHAQGGTQAVHIEMAREGMWISLDNVMVDNIDLYVSMLQNLKNHKLLNRVLLSHDAGYYDVIDPAATPFRGYTAIFSHLKPALLSNGFTEDDWQLMTVSNPREAYIVRIRKLGNNS